jgi:hypothetical protein
MAANKIIMSKAFFHSVIPKKLRKFFLISFDFNLKCLYFQIENITDPNTKHAKYHVVFYGTKEM